MAQAHLLDRRVFLGDRPGVHRHRVDILQHDRVRADRHHVLADRPQMRHRAQGAHDAADPERIGDGVAQAVFLRHLEIGDRARLVAADLEGDDDEVGSLECRPLLGMGLDPRRRAERGGELVGDDGRFFQPLLVRVHQRDGRAGQCRPLQYVADNVLHEYGRARANERDLRLPRHRRSPENQAAMSNAARTSRLV